MNNTNLITRLNLVLLASCALTFLINFASYNLMVVGGDQLQGLDKQIAKLSLENQLLQEQIAQTHSLQLAQNEADKYGFTSITKPLTLPTTVPVAYNLSRGN